MKKVLKKMLMFLIAATMLLQMGITIFAADSNGSAEQPVAAAGGLEDLAKKSVQYLHQLADNKIKDAIGKIPVVGGTVKSLFGSYIDKLLGIEKKELIREVHRMIPRVERSGLSYDKEKIQKITELLEAENVDYYGVVSAVESIMQE